MGHEAFYFKLLIAQTYGYVFLLLLKCTDTIQQPVSKETECQPSIRPGALILSYEGAHQLTTPH